MTNIFFALLFQNSDYKIELNDSFFDTESISPPNYDDDLDQRIHTTLLNLNGKEIKSITLPINLTENYLEFSGLLFAYHLRLTRELTFCEVPIIFYGTLDLEQLLRLTPLARILPTNNIQYVNIVNYSFDDIQKSLDRYEPKRFNINEFLEQIQINPPSNYDTHHSIDNEFALIQWSRFTGCFDKLPSHFKNEFESQLYFKYLTTKNPLPEIKENNQFSISTIEKTRVLLIDDEAKKGWGKFYESILKNSNVEFKDSGIDFKNENKDYLIAKVESKVKEFNPDVVLLDLRLVDSDFDKEIATNELSGLKILDKIKEINKGIQVIITTASNKAWNFDLAKQKGAYDFIIKDGFEDSKKAINKINTAIVISSKRAGFLKIIDQKLSDLKFLIFANNHFKDKDDKERGAHDNMEDKIRKRMFSNLELAFELLDLSYMIPDKHKYLAYSYLQMFLLIEDFANSNTSEKLDPILFNESDQIFINHSLKQICILQMKGDRKLTRLVFDSKYKLVNYTINLQRKLDTNFFVSSLLIYKYGNPNSSTRNWTSVYTVRNDVAHEGYMPKEIEINQLLDFMLYFFDKSNESSANLDKGLQPITYNESLNALTTKYKNK